MKNIFFILFMTTLLTSCKSKTESCIERLIDEEGYTYDEACDECEEMRLESEARYERY